MDLTNKKILVTGGGGFVGHFVRKSLKDHGVPEKNIFWPRSHEYDLREKLNCLAVTKKQDVVIHLAGNVGGIGYNRDNPYTLWHENSLMGLNMIEAARICKVEKFVTIGTICEYPKFTPVPFSENSLWNGYPEETNAPYGIAKKSLLVGGQALRQQHGLSVIHLLMVNLYGPRDNFDLNSSHVVPAIIRKVRQAVKNKQSFIECWGTGKATREFLYVEDAALGIVLAAQLYDKPEPVNIGAGMEISIKDLTTLVCEIMGFEGEIRWDSSKPDGQPRRSLDVTRAEKEFGFKAKTNFKTGLEKTIEWYLGRGT